MSTLKIMEINQQDYLNGWICYCLFIREIEKKFNEDQAKAF